MLMHYLKWFVRTVRRHPGHYGLITGGLILGFTACFIMVLYIQDELQYDRFHDQADQIYRLTMSVTENGSTRSFAEVPPMFPQELKQEYPVIRKFVRLRKVSGAISISTEPFQEGNLLYADSTFFNLFSFQLLQGDPETALRRSKSVVLTESLARKYFGSENPMGKTLRFRSDSQDRDMDVVVTGVVADPPDQSHVDFDMLISMVTLKAEELQSYQHALYYSYLLLRPDASWQKLEAQFHDFILRVSGPEAAQWLTLELQPLTAIHLHSHKIAELRANGSVTHLLILGTVALFILVISALNFINLFTSRATTRTQEVEIRKIYGAGRRVLIRQFLSETLMVSLLAGIVSLAVLDLVLPLINTMTGKELSLWSAASGLLPVSLLGLALLTGLLAGIYPAVFLSRYQPLTQLNSKGGTNAAGAGLRRSLVIVQFMLSIILLAGTFTIMKQLRYVQSKDLGFAENQLLVIPHQLKNPGEQTIVEWKQHLRQYPGIQGVAASSGVLGSAMEMFTFYPEGHTTWESRTLHVLYVDTAYLTTYGLSLSSGRNFSRGMRTEQQSFLLNEAAAQALGWKDPVGKVIRQSGDPMEGTVIGVVKDFHYASLHQRIEPLVLGYRPARCTTLAVKVAPQHMQETIASIRSICEKINPTEPFEYFFLDQHFAQLYRQDRRLGHLVQIFSMLAIVIACLGLYGLAAFSTERRIKEIGIRKVLGANAGQVLLLLSGDFLRMVIMAFFLAAPIAFFMMHWWLRNFAYHISPSPLLILAGGGVSLIIAVLTVSFQSLRAASTNPVEALRYE